MKSIFALSKPQSYFYLFAWIFLILFAGKYMIMDALPYFGMEKDVFGRWWDFKWTLVGHIAGGLLALAIGPFQFWKAFRTKYLAAHRTLGKVYIIAIIIGSIASTVLAWTTALKVHFSWAIALQCLALAWIVTTLMAYRTIRLKRIDQHKEWMIRSYVITFAFVLFRFMNELPAVRALGEFTERGATELWLSWVIPLFITEVMLQWNKK